jgi:hypothetical protein
MKSEPTSRKDTHIPTVNSAILYHQGMGGTGQARYLLDDTLLGKAQLKGP